MALGTVLAGLAAAGAIAPQIYNKIKEWWQGTPEGKEDVFPEVQFPEIKREELPGVAAAKGPRGEGVSIFERFTPAQKKVFGELQTAIGPLLQQLGTGGVDFPAIAEEARTQFREQTIPSIAERFTGMGGGAQSTGAFARTLGQAGAGLERGLAAEQARFGGQQQALQQQLLTTLLGTGLTPQFESTMSPGRPSFGESIGGAVAGGLGMATPLALSALFK